MLRQLTAAFISGCGLQSVLVKCVRVTDGDVWDKIRIKSRIKWFQISVSEGCSTNGRRAMMQSSVLHFCIIIRYT